MKLDWIEKPERNGVTEWIAYVPRGSAYDQPTIRNESGDESLLYEARVGSDHTQWTELTFGSLALAKRWCAVTIEAMEHSQREEPADNPRPGRRR